MKEENAVGEGPDDTSRKPVPPFVVLAVAGNCVSTEAGTVKLARAPAVVVQMNSVAFVVLVVPDVVVVPE